MSFVEIVGLVGSIVGIVGFVLSCIDKESRLREKIVLGVLIGSLLVTGITLLKLDEFNNVKKEATNLVEAWPKGRDGIAFLSIGELRGLALSGFSFLERHKSYFPESFEQISLFIHNDLNLTSKNVNDDYSEERDKLEEAYEMVSRIITDIADVKK